MDLTNVPEHTKAGLLAMNADKPLVKFGDQAELAQKVIDQYLDGSKMVEIAKGYEVSPERLYMLLHEYAPEDWMKAVAAKSDYSVDKDLDSINNAVDGLSVSRARESARLHTWRLERVARRMYGAQPPSAMIQVNLGDVLQQMKDLERDLGIGGDIVRHIPSITP